MVRGALETTAPPVSLADACQGRSRIAAASPLESSWESYYDGPGWCWLAETACQHETRDLGENRGQKVFVRWLMASIYSLTSIVTRWQRGTGSLPFQARLAEGLGVEESER